MVGDEALGLKLMILFDKSIWCLQLRSLSKFVAWVLVNLYKDNWCEIKSTMTTVVIRKFKKIYYFGKFTIFIYRKKRWPIFARDKKNVFKTVAEIIPIAFLHRIRSYEYIISTTVALQEPWFLPLISPAVTQKLINLSLLWTIPTPSVQQNFNYRQCLRARKIFLQRHCTEHSKYL